MKISQKQALSDMDGIKDWCKCIKQSTVSLRKRKNPLDHISLSCMYCANMLLSEQKCAKKKKPTQKVNLQP